MTCLAPYFQLASCVPIPRDCIDRILKSNNYLMDGNHPYEHTSLLCPVLDSINCTGISQLIFVTVGGLMGFLKSGSQKSLLAGGLSAALLFYVSTELPVRPVFASSIGLGKRSSHSQNFLYLFC